LSVFRKSFEQYLGTIDSGLYPLDAQLKNNYDKIWLLDNGYKIYLLVSNSTSNEETFCVAIQQSQATLVSYVLPTDTFFLSSQASYGNQHIALDASYAQPIPGFLFSTYSVF
jgi:predicted cupin superfamily sugar epimerase